MNAPRLAAPLEVLGIYLAGSLVTQLLRAILQADVANPLNDFRVDITNAELIAASGTSFVLLVLQYAGWFALIVPINWWRCQWGPSAYGLTRAGRSWMALLTAGAATAALTQWPVLAVALTDSVYQLGDTVPWRQALFDTSWRRWEFWLFTGVMSWGFVAIMEELFFRGYCQPRLAEAWGHGPAILCIACLFTFAHGQYLAPDAYNTSMVVSLFALAIGLGVVRAWSGSLVPGIVAHAIINVTMTPFWQGVLLIVFGIVAAIAAWAGLRAFRAVFAQAGAPACLMLAAAGAIHARLAARFDALVYVAVAMVVLAVALEAWSRGSARAVE